MRETDDDALILSKKRTTHGPVIRKDIAALSPEKNRFRIYFASPVEDADGPSLKALHAMEPVEEGDAEQEESEDDDDDDEHEEGDQEEGDGENDADQGDHDGQEEEFYEAQGDDADQAQDVEQNGVQNDKEPEAQVEVKDEPVDENKDEGDMSGVVEEDEAVEVKKPEEAESTEPKEAAVESEQTGEAQQVESLVETKEEDVTMREPSLPPQTEPEAASSEVKIDGPAEKAAVESTETEPSAVNVSVETTPAQPAEPTPETPAETAPAKQSRQKPSAPAAPREPANQRFADARFRRSPSLPATSSDTPRPESNRLSILYANGKRRICLDSAIVESVKIHRKKGSIQVILDAGAVKRKWEQDKQVEQIVKRIRETEVVDEGEKKDKDGDGEKGKGKTDDDNAIDSAKTTTGEPVKAEEWSLTKGILVSTHPAFSYRSNSRAWLISCLLSPGRSA